MERLSGLDATFLYVENPSHHMHVSMVSVFDPATMAGGYSFDAVQAVVVGRLTRIPMFRRRLVTVPLHLGHPVWIDDPHFDIDYHFRRAAVPSPGGLPELCEMAADFMSRPLDRAKPMWEMQVVEGLQDGRIGVLAKVHHSMVDGVSGAEIMVHLFDLEPQPPPEAAAPPPDPAGERVPSELELVGRALASAAVRPLRLLSLVPRTVGAAVGLVRVRRGSTGRTMPAPFSAPRTPFNAAITPHRSVAATRLGLNDVKDVKRAFGCTVNDVVLALCGGALRRYLDRLGELPDKPLIAVVPISVRDQTRTEGSNAVSAMFTTLATDLADPGERIAAIHETTKGAKEEHNALGADLLTDWAEFAAPAVFTRASRLYTSMKLADRHRPIHNVVVSNVPGPNFPLFFAGARLEMLFPLGPVMEGAGLNITVLSYLDSIDVGLIACRELVPDLWDLAHAFEEAMEELLLAAKAAKAAPTA
jgi:diacylglycerol O-acyltransferase / wax synthase